MQNEKNVALQQVEQTQNSLKQNIEESVRLIDQAQDAIQRFRESQERKPEAA